MPAHGYTLDNSWDKALERLRLLEYQLDPVSLQYFQKIGVTTGWQCLEIGAGGGSIATWLCDAVGPSGSVTVVDINTRHVAALNDANLIVLEQDIAATQFTNHQFDFIHARLIFTHVKNNVQVLKKLATYLKPGGWILIEESDFSSLHINTAEQSSKDFLLFSNTINAIHSWQETQGMSVNFGAKIFGLFGEMDLNKVEAHGHLSMIKSQSIESKFFYLTFEQLKTPIVSSNAVSATDYEKFLALFNKDTFTFSTPLLISTIGCRPV